MKRVLKMLALSGLVVGVLIWMGSDYAFSQATLISTYAIAGLGVMLIVGQAGQITLGQGGLMAIGAYAETLLAMHGLPVLFSLPLVLLLGALGGLIAGLPAMRLHGLFFGMSTLAFALIVEESLLRMEFLTNGAQGLTVPVMKVFFPLETPFTQFLFSAVMLIAALFVCNRLITAPLGRLWRAVREDELAAGACGIDAVKVKMSAFVAGGSLSALAGALYAHWIGFVSPEQFGLALSFELLVLAFIGGSRLFGVVIGAGVIIAVPQCIALCRDLFPEMNVNSYGLETALFGAIIVLVVLWRSESPGQPGNASAGCSRNGTSRT